MRRTQKSLVWCFLVVLLVLTTFTYIVAQGDVEAEEVAEVDAESEAAEAELLRAEEEARRLKAAEEEAAAALELERQRAAERAAAEEAERRKREEEAAAAQAAREQWEKEEEERVARETKAEAERLAAIKAEEERIAAAVAEAAKKDAEGAITLLKTKISGLTDLVVLKSKSLVDRVKSLTAKQKKQAFAGVAVVGFGGVFLMANSGKAAVPAAFAGRPNKK
jgi:hypothetical protein